MKGGRSPAAEPSFQTRLLPSGLVVPAIPLVVALIAGASDALPIGLLSLGGAVLLLVLYAASSLDVHADGTICVRHWSVRRRCMSANQIAWIYATQSEIFPRAAPNLRVEAADRHQLKVGLGTWRRESDLLDRLQAVAGQVGARTDERTRQLFRRRPPGWFWERRQLQRWPRARPFKRQGLVRVVHVCGLAMTALGLVLVVVTDQTRPGIGSLGRVPDAIVGLNAIVLGLMAVLMARPRRELKRIVISVWVPLVVAIVLGFGALIVALAEWAPGLAINRWVVAVVLTLGYASWIVTITLGLSVGAVRVVGHLLRRLIGDHFA